MYRYRCTACGAQEEHLQKFSDPPMQVCGSCGGALTKQMTAAAFHLKGGGWYKDLYASSKSDGAGKSDSAATSSESSKSDASSKSDSSSAASSSSSSSSSSGSSSSASSTAA